ncbi:MAG: glutamate--tRNA ligase [FCB group bacterium]|nr:glutamate--tRNA ligase [FCB group bacterium]
MIKTRFAPSPTGYLHLGGLRTALYNYLYARKTGGKVVLRIEDTDQNRKVEGAVDNLLETFDKMGIRFDEGPRQGGSCGPYFQSDRLPLYREQLQRLLDSGQAYPCFCTPERLAKVREERAANKLNTPYDRHCIRLPRQEALDRMQSEPHVVRMKIPSERTIRFYDIIRDAVEFNCAEIDDQVLFKTDGFPTYHFANVVDDHFMEITHVIRGEEWLPSTPKHILLYEFFGWKAPKFAHLPLLLNPDRSKLSKRQGDVAVEAYLQKGYLPEALNNYVALLGWAPGNDREMFSLDQLEKAFSLKGLQKSGAVFDVEKLKWMNGHYLRELPLKQIAHAAEPRFRKAGIDISDKEKYFQVVDDARRRISILDEILNFSKMFYEAPVAEGEHRSLTDNQTSQKLFQFWLDNLHKLAHPDEESLKELIQKTTDELGISGKNLYWPLRIALYGSPHGPDIPTLLKILGLKESIKRLQRQLN